MPAVPVFKPDPLLCRAAAQGGGFDALSLLVPSRLSFLRDPLLEGQVGAAPLLAAPGAALATASPHAAGASAPALAAPSVGAADEGAQLAADGEPGLDHPPSLDAQAWTELLSARYREGFEEGLAQGAALGRNAELEESAATARAQGEADALLAEVAQAVRTASAGPDAAQRFEPLKRLALHLASELVRQELALQPGLVERLVERCVRFLQPEGRPVVVELNPQDLSLLRSQGLLERMAQAVQAQALASSDVGVLNWREDAKLSRGSVRARCEESTVEDLIEHRLASLMRELQVDTARWQADEERLQAQRLEPGPADTSLPAQEAAALNPEDEPVPQSDPPTAPPQDDHA